MDVLGEEVHLVLTASAGSAQAEQAIKAFGPGLDTQGFGLWLYHVLAP